MARRNIDLGHPNHGRGGKSGHQIAETHTRNVTIEKVNERIIRARAKTERKKERNIAELSKKIGEIWVPKTNELFVRLSRDYKILRGSKRAILIKILAVNEWFVDEVEKELIKRKLTHEKLDLEEREQIGLGLREDRLKYRVHLLGANPSELTIKDFHEQIKKWKGRVPKMLIGQY